MCTFTDMLNYKLTGRPVNVTVLSLESIFLAPCISQFQIPAWACEQVTSDLRVGDGFPLGAPNYRVQQLGSNILLAKRGKLPLKFTATPALPLALPLYYNKGELQCEDFGQNIRPKKKSCLFPVTLP